MLSELGLALSPLPAEPCSDSWKTEGAVRSSLLLSSLLLNDNDAALDPVSLLALPVTPFLNFNDAGGGGTAREYMNAAKEVGDVSQDEMDWLGIAATRLNARLLLSVLADVAYPEVITDPTAIPEGIEQPPILCAGWKPGWSTDTVAAIAARERGAKMVLNLSNIEYVYDDDPSKNPDAKPYTEMGWDQYRAMVGNEWSPGMNAPFDPIASKIANEEGMTVVVANGRLENLTAMLSNEPFEGTILK